MVLEQQLTICYSKSYMRDKADTSLIYTLSRSAQTTAVVNGAISIQGLYFRTFATQDHYNQLEKVAPAMAGVAGVLLPAMYKYYTPTEQCIWFKYRNPHKTCRK